MVVKAQCNGRGIIGLDVGIDNVRRYFPERVPAIELQLGHLQIQCDLSPDFWNGRPEIRDRRLCAWLEAKNLNGKYGQAAVSMAMIPSGKNSFRLQPLSVSGNVETRLLAQPAA